MLLIACVIFLLTTFWVPHVHAQADAGNVKIEIGKPEPVDCHQTAATGGSGDKICQTTFPFAVHNLGDDRISIDMLCGNGPNRPFKKTSFHVELDAQKSTKATAVATRLRAEDKAGMTCVLQVNGKQTEIFKNYRPEWR
jgi:hypothetical protein